LLKYSGAFAETPGNKFSTFRRIITMVFIDLYNNFSTYIIGDIIAIPFKYLFSKKYEEQKRSSNNSALIEQDNN
jgi:hypothetical protein